MNFSTFLKKLKEFFLDIYFKKFNKKHQPKISLLIPFSSKNPIRKKVFKWLLKYWKHELPDAEIIIGRSKSKIFCKGEALNDAFERSNGKVLVIIDSDAYMSGDVIEYCADRILEELENHLWYVPYRRLFRLTKCATSLIINSDPKDPYKLPDPLPDDYIENQGDRQKYGHRYGAMIMIFPREALDAIGCFDERFVGWGGEDVALLRALDTLYGKHKTTNNDIYHLWHPFIGDTQKVRMWDGQKTANVNSNLANQYNRATRHPSKMKKIIEESIEYRKNKQLL
jgi:N-terminal domain of galactosyltransferase